ncbi:MAG: Nif3-like dinuclear metal center hexameric protein [Planctomycetota bacterium]
MPLPLADIVRALGMHAPLALAEPWDKVGLLVAGDGRPVSRALLAIDLVPEVLDEARAAGAELVIAYHPLLFKPLERLDGATWQGRVAIAAVRAGIAVYSPHTALDAVAGGVNDWLVDSLAGEAAPRRPIKPAAARSPGFKLVVFVPLDAADRVRDALAAAGAGVIGDDSRYTHCSFAAAGQGTFLGGEGANPAVGKAGRLERVQELRLEMAVPANALAPAVSALRDAHPYEEPAFDIFRMEPDPSARGASANAGAGRIATLAQPMTSDEVARGLEQPLGVVRTDIARASDPSRRHAVVAFCAGSGSSLAESAAAEGATLFVTGEASHHDVLHARSLGLDFVLAGHTSTERGYLPRYARALAQRIAGVEFLVSQADRDPLRA